MQVEGGCPVSFPLVYFHNNIVFTQQQAFAIYSIPQLPFKFLKQESKKLVLDKLEEFLHGYSGKGQILYLVNPIEFDEGRYLSKAGVGSQSPALLKEAHQHATEAQANCQNIKAWKRTVYLVLELPISGWGKTALKTTFNELKETIIEQLFTKKRQTITPKLIQEAESLERELLYQHKNTLGLNPVEFNELDYIIRRNLHRGWEMPPTLPPRKKGAFDNAMTLALGDGVIFEEKLNCMKFVGPDNREHWQAFLTMVDMPKELLPATVMNMPWIAELNYLPQPVDAAIHFTSTPSFEAKRKLGLRKGLLKDQIREYEKGDEETSLDIDWAEEEARNLESKLTAGMSLGQVGCTLAAWAPDIEQLESQVKQVVQRYQTNYFRLVRAPGDQLKMFYSFIPGSKQAGPLIECDPGYIAASGIQAGLETGDYNGFTLGHTVSGMPVLFNPGEAMQRHHSGTTVITGVLGTGKSTLKKYIIYLAALKGARVVCLDPKNEDHVFSLLPFKTRQIDFSYTGGARFNPLKVSPDALRSRDIAQDYLSIILSIGDNEARKLVISEALENAYNLPLNKQNLFTVTDWLGNYSDVDSEKTNEARRCARLLEAYQKSSLGQIIFTDDTTLSLESSQEQITICNISELPLPKKNNTNPLSDSEKQAVGLLFLIAAATREIMFRSEFEHLAFACDEAWMLLNIPEGERLIDELVRMSRSFGIIPILVTQNGSDVKKKSIRNNIGYVYCFKARDNDEIFGNAQLLEVDSVGEEIPKTFRSLKNGQCIMRDPEGRVEEVQINPQPTYLLDIFDTSPGKKRKEVKKVG